MKTEAGARVLDRCDFAVAVVVARRRVVQNADGCNLTVRPKLDDLVSIRCGSAVPVVHGLLPLGWFETAARPDKVRQAESAGRPCRLKTSGRAIFVSSP